MFATHHRAMSPSLTHVVTVREHGKLNGRRIGGPKSEVFVCRLPHDGYWLVTFQGLPLWATAADYWTAEQVARWLVGGCLHGKLVQGFPMLDERSRTYLGQRPELLAAYQELLPKRNQVITLPPLPVKAGFTMTALGAAA